MSKSKIIDGLFLQDNANIERVENSLSATVVPSEELEELSQEVDTLQTRISSDQEQEKLISCYGKLETLAVNNAVDEVFEAILDLQQATQLSAAKKRALKRQIETLEYHYALSAENRAYLKVMLRKLATKEEGACAAELAAPIGLNSSSSEEEQRGHLALHLCEAAYFFYSHAITQGTQLLNQLTDEQKERFHAHLDAVGAHPLDEVDAAHLDLYRKNLLLFIQALLGYANELAQNDTIFFYPSEEEVHAIFSEMQHI